MEQQLCAPVNQRHVRFLDLGDCSQCVHCAPCMQLLRKLSELHPNAFLSVSPTSDACCTRYKTFVSPVETRVRRVFEFSVWPRGPYLGAPLATRHSKALNVPCTAVQMTIAPEWFLAVSECNMCCEKRPSRAEYVYTVFVKLDVRWTTDVEQFKTRRHTGMTTVPWMTPDNVYTNMCCMVGTAVAWQCQDRGSVGSLCSA